MPVFVNFNQTPLSISSRRQLSATARRDANPSPQGLARLICENVFDVRRGIYIPVSPMVELVGKLPDVSRTLILPETGTVISPLPCFFTNPLLIPTGYGDPEFQGNVAPPPKCRAVNAGFLLVTLEFDSRRPQELDEQLGWTRSSSPKGDFSGAPLAKVHRELCQIREYRGVSAVYSGNKSVHFHFVFSTEHLVNAPYDATADERTKDFELTAALMANVHARYWDHVNELFVRILNPSLPADPRLRILTQWRRSPGALRRASGNSFLGFPADSFVHQLSLREKLVERAPKRNSGFLVSESFSLANPLPRARMRNKIRAHISVDVPPEILSMLEECCLSEWGEWPKPTAVEIQNGEWLFRFLNHEDDHNPSTIALGDHRCLQLNGDHRFEDRRFFLPDQMTAQELGDHLAERIGWGRMTVRPDEPDDRLNLELRVGGSVFDNGFQLGRIVVRDIDVSNPEAAKRAYRDALGRQIAQRCDLGMVYLVVSVEGIGKSTACLPILADLALNDAIDHKDKDNVERFSGFAFRSRIQASEKAREFGRTHRVRMITSFWKHYAEACSIEEQRAIPRDEFENVSPAAVLSRIRDDQPEVYARLERTRTELWREPERFDGGITLLCMTHKAAQLWPSTGLTRAWHHPDFDPEDADKQDFAVLRDRFRLNRIVFDDCEPDDFVYIMPESTFEFLARQHERHQDWRNTPREQRIEVYRHLGDDLPRRIADFESFDEYMRLDLATFERVQVNFDAIPFGHDHTNSGIYRRCHGDNYYVGPKPWLTENPAEFTFLTTETLVAKVIERAFGKIPAGPARRPVIGTLLDQVPPFYPAKIPVQLDRRAAADRREGDRISALAGEIKAGNPDALVIADGVENKDMKGVITFQGMKGQNTFTERDISIIPTCLNPEKFAELNVMGRWLGIDDIIARYYDDQLNQAVGRNRGFRLSNERGTTTRVVISPRLWHHVLKKRSQQANRVRLYIEVPPTPVS